MTESSSASVTSRASAYLSSCAGSARHPAATASRATVAQPDFGRPVDGSTSRTCLSPRLRRRPEAECFRRSLERHEEMQGQRQIWRHLRDLRDHVSNQHVPRRRLLFHLLDLCFLLVLSVEMVFCLSWTPWWTQIVASWEPEPQSRFHVGPWRVALQEPSSVDRIGTGDLLMGLPLSSPPSGGLPRSPTHSP